MKSEKTSFVLGKKNIVLLAVGFALVILGFVLMSGGKAESADDFKPEEIFSTTRISVAPIVVLLGFAVVGIAIMIKPDKTLTE